MAWIIEPDDEAASEGQPLPVGMPVMVVTLTPDGGIFEGIVMCNLVPLHHNHFRVVVELREENIIDRYPRRFERNNPENHPDAEEGE